MRALHRSIDDRHLEQRKARRQLLLLGMVVAVAVASLLQISVLRTGAPMDFMARHAAGGLADQGRTPYDQAELLAAEQQLWPGISVVPFYDPHRPRRRFGSSRSCHSSKQRWRGRC
jgi:hypothetical protein